MSLILFIYLNFGDFAIPAEVKYFTLSAFVWRRFFYIYFALIRVLLLIFYTQASNKTPQVFNLKRLVKLAHNNAFQIN
jgi:hypothetical protein